MINDSSKEKKRSPLFPELEDEFQMKYCQSLDSGYNFRNEYGSAAIYEDHSNKILWIHVITAREQRKGLGTKLVISLEEYAKKQNLKQLVITIPSLPVVKLIATKRIAAGQRYYHANIYSEDMNEYIDCLWTKI